MLHFLNIKFKRAHSTLSEHMCTHCHQRQGKRESPLSNRVWTGVRWVFQGIPKRDSEHSFCNQVTVACYSSARIKDNLWKAPGIFLLTWHECEVRNNWRTCDTAQKQKLKVSLFIIFFWSKKYFLTSMRLLVRVKIKVCDKTQIPVANGARKFLRVTHILKFVFLQCTELII